PSFLKTSEPMGAPTYSEHIAQEIDLEVRRMIEEQGRRVRALLSSIRGVMLQGAEKLLQDEVMTGEELKALLSAQKEEPSISR
ncbi:MAG: hypothetical protein KC643_23725, partial [Nitrospira sp.]|nr:hypothetical protein [Nitrospira sp.]